MFRKSSLTSADYCVIISGRMLCWGDLGHYLGEKEFLRILPFDATTHPMATMEDIDPLKVGHFVHVAREKRGLSLPLGSSVHTVLTHLGLISPDEKIGKSNVPHWIYWANGNWNRRYYP